MSTLNIHKSSKILHITVRLEYINCIPGVLAKYIYLSRELCKVLFVILLLAAEIPNTKSGIIRAKQIRITDTFLKYKNTLFWNIHYKNIFSIPESMKPM